MAPALTKTTGKDNSPVVGIDKDPQIKLLESCYAQKVLLKLSSLPFLDTCSPQNSLEVPEMLLPPLLQDSRNYVTVFLSDSESQQNLLPVNKTQPNSERPRPGMQELQFVSFPEHSRLGVTEPHENMNPGQAGKPPPDCYGVTQSHLLKQHVCGEASGQDCTSALTPSTLSQDADHMRSVTTDLLWNSRAQNQLASVVTVEEALRSKTLCHVSQLSALMVRANRIQHRLQALLGEHALHHYSYQLEDLRRKLSQGNCPPKSFESAGGLSTPLESKLFDAPVKQEERYVSDVPQNSRDVQRFVRCGSTVLQGLQKILDSDCTDSSSDEEWDRADTKGTSAPSRQCLGCRWKWHRERAEIGSRWTWLQLRISELECKIQQLDDLHRQILATKGGVVLAESQPLTDRQIQQMLLTETAGLSFTAGNAQGLSSDTDMEPSSPTHLLRTIERQSAQLSQIVNSLMPPLSLSPSSSPVSKAPSSRWRAQQKRAFISDVAGGETELRRKRRRQHAPQDDLTCICARTRPLLTYHKPRLFTLDLCPSHTKQAAETCCFSWDSCDPGTKYRELDCSSNPETASRPKPRPARPLSLASETSPPLRTDDWLQRPVSVKPEESSPLRDLSYEEWSHGRHLKRSRGEPSSGRWPRFTQGSSKQTCRAGRKQTRYNGTAVDAGAYLSCLSTQSSLAPQSSEDSADEAPEDVGSGQTVHMRQRTSQGPVRRRHGDSVYNIDNIVIPMSLAAPVKLERLQYKDILTPSWRVLDILPLEQRQDGDTEEVELLSDDVFSKRHQECECRERLRWCSWEENRRCRRSTRASSSNCLAVFVRDSPSQSHPPAHLPWRSCSPVPDSEGGLEEREVQQPWERRVFPLCEEEEKALKCDEDSGQCSAPQWSLRRDTDNCGSEHSILSVSCSAVLPSAGDRENDMKKARGQSS
ncbi:KAT8 regulatory NSL complex subunit 1-like protein [Chanos chanos]|uniref:KAT8 regulatory NSL complex subunit 1-like protein n=1 Tax=Chanos chanos TaxID=29144 RepID=A0A6J2WGR3_CHACN|nr:KAT8 regulatory NSL complex subunit 1-like protein [Chanos chanos]